MPIETIAKRRLNAAWRCKERCAAFLAQKVAFRHGHCIGRLPGFGAFQIRRDLLFERVIANLRRQCNGAATALASHFETQALVPRQRALVVLAVGLDVAGARACELTAIETHGGAIGIEVDDDAVERFVHGAGRRRAHEDQRFVGTDEPQPIVDFRNRALRIAEALQLSLLVARSRSSEAMSALNGRQVARRGNVLTDRARKLNGNEGDDEENDRRADRATDGAKGGTKALQRAVRTGFKSACHSPSRRYFR